MLTIVLEHNHLPIFFNVHANDNMEEQSNTGLGSLLQVDWQNFVGALTKAVDDHCRAATSTAEWDSA